MKYNKKEFIKKHVRRFLAEAKKASDYSEAYNLMLKMVEEAKEELDREMTKSE